MSYRLYILMRNDLPSMSPGRAMAQAAHASNQFIFEWYNDHEIKKWQLEARGFGTTICLSATQDEIKQIDKEARKNGIASGLVYDPTYRYSLHLEYVSIINPKSFTAASIYKDDGQVVMFRRELTCGYLFIENESSEQQRLVGALPLHP